MQFLTDQMLPLSRFGAENKQGYNKDFICEKEKRCIALRSIKLHNIRQVRCLWRHL